MMLLVTAAVVATDLARQSFAQTVTEIHYHPPEGEEELEFIEITNEYSGPQDLSGFAFVEGIRFVLPPGTVLRGGESLVVCADAEAVRTRYGIDNVVGDFEGRLDSGGERVTLVNHVGVVVLTLRYDDDGKWPLAPDGAGHTLELRKIYLDPSEPESWRQSFDLGGTPGRFDSPLLRPDVPPPEVHIDHGDLWRFAKGTAPFSTPTDGWRQIDFDDSSWLVGASPFAGPDVEVEPLGTLLDDMVDSYTGLAVRHRFFVEAGEIASHRFFLAISYDDGFCAFLNGEEFARSNCPLDPTFESRAAGSHVADVEERFFVPPSLLRGGENVIAVQGLNVSRRQGDFVLAPRLTKESTSPGETVLVDHGHRWRFAKGTGPFSEPNDAWLDPDFDDSGWLSGRSSFGFGDEEHATVLDDMRGNYTSIALRTSFEWTEELDQQDGDLLLLVDYDDGFCAFLNGTFVGRDGCPEEVAWNSVATRVREAGEVTAVLLPRKLLRLGSNWLSLVGVNTSRAGDDFSLTPRLMFRRSSSPPTLPEFPVVFNELQRGSAADGGWVELYNTASEAVDLSGLQLARDPDSTAPFVFAPGESIEGGGFLVVAAAGAGLDLGPGAETVQLFVWNEDGLVVAAASFDHAAAINDPAGVTEALFPDGGGRAWATTTPTPGSANEIDRVADLVIHEIFYHPPLEREGEFIELFHRGSVPLDISGFRFTKGIEFTFPGGTIVAPGDFVVIAKQPENLERTYSLTGVYGPFDGVLADAGENVRLVDRLGNLVDEVRYFDSGRWPDLADGRGSSLELVDPRQDNDHPSAWAASDETGKAEWEQFTFAANDLRVSRGPDLNLYMGSRGVCLVDDIRLVRRGTTRNLVPNPSFERGVEPWRALGTHVESEVVSGDAPAGDAALRVVATGKGNPRCNRVEIELDERLVDGSFDVSLWAKWQSGSSLLLFESDYAAGPYRSPFENGGMNANMSATPIAARLRVAVPLDLGTPGAENSVSRQLRLATGEVNLGPIIRDVRHVPVSPLPNASVTVFAAISDADGVGRVEVFYRDEEEDQQQGDGFAAVAMVPVSAADDTGAQIYAAEIPAVSFPTTKSFYIEAVDSLGSVERFPVDAPDRRCVYRVKGFDSERVRVLLTDEADFDLFSRHISSNRRVDATFSLDDERVMYNVQLRYRGSPWGRTVREGLRVRFGGDDALIFGRKNVNLTIRDRLDSVGYLLTGHAGTAEKRVLVSNYRFLSARFRGARMGMAGLFEPFDRTLAEAWYGKDAASRAVFLKGNGRMHYDNDCVFTFWDGASLVYRGEEAVDYRFYYEHSANQERDEWSSFADLTRVMDREVTSDEEFDRLVDSVLDVETFLRAVGARALMGGGDALLVHTGHNGFMVRDPNDGLWEHAPFDYGGGAVNPTTALLEMREPNVQRLLERTPIQRRYLQILHEFVSGYLSSDSLRIYVEALVEDIGIGGDELRRFISGSRTQVAEWLGQFTAVPLRILTNDGENYVAPSSSIDLEGEAPIDVAALFLRRGGEAARPLDIVWLTSTQWRASLQLETGPNVFEITGEDSSGAVTGAASITITLGSESTFRRGDVNDDGRFNVSDPLRTILFLFRGQPLLCLDAADVDDNGEVDLSDAIAELNFLFRRGEPPAAPYPNAGPDTSADTLGCVR